MTGSAAAQSPSGVVVTLDQIYDQVKATHEAVQPLVHLPERADGLERRIRSLENWRLVLATATVVSSGTAVASLFQVPLLYK